MASSPHEPLLRTDERVIAALLVFVPLSLAAAHLGWPSLVQFLLALAAVIPLAAFIGIATEELAERLGGKIGGLLNATFGNAPDVLVGVFGVQKGLIPLVKATLIGALISNSALIMGLCCIAAGVTHRRPRFDRHEAGHHSVLMMLALGGVLFPTVGAMVICGGVRCDSVGHRDTIQHVSVGIAVILLCAYAAYVVYGVLGVEGRRAVVTRERDAVPGRGVATLTPRDAGAAATPADTSAAAHAAAPRWPLWLSVSVLGASTLLLLPVIDALTSAVAPVTQVLGLTEVFVGMVIVANAGNAAEAYAAIRFAIRGPGAPEHGRPSGLDLSIGIASASSIQIATFVLPVVVLYSLAAHPMSLVFSGVEVAILLLLVLVFAFISQDGESNWLEGFQLLALYAMAGVLFYALPVDAFAG